MRSSGVDPVERYGPVFAARMEAEQRSAMRRRAIRRLPFVAAIPVVAVAAFLLARGLARSRGWTFGGGLGVALGVSGVPLLSALAEMLTGIEVQRLASRWDALSGWQRGIIGTGIVVLATALFLAVAFAIATHLGR
jgi:hypothetical protein